MKKYDYLIVGSGLTGSLYAHKLQQKNKKCLVIDKRAHFGGNLYCENIDGINVHKYGAHIFHTSSSSVWRFVNSFVSFNRYTNSPIADYNGKLYNLPFNMNTFYTLWGTKTPEEAQEKIEKQRKKISCTNPANLEEQAISLIGTDIYKILIKDYTEKQWGRKCTELPAFIIKRLPIRFTFDNNYFNDSFQGIPIGGYNKLISGLLQDIDVQLNYNFFSERSYLESIAKKIIYTGPIDEYYNYKYGQLEYRTVHFETEVLNIQNYQGNAVVNYTSHSKPYTRIIEHKHFEPESESFVNNKTVISREFSSEWSKDAEPFYPVNDNKNNSLYKKYKELANKTNDVLFSGRLAEYKYYDMDDIVDKVIKCFMR